MREWSFRDDRIWWKIGPTAFEKAHGDTDIRQLRPFPKRRSIGNAAFEDRGRRFHQAASSCNLKNCAR